MLLGAIAEQTNYAEMYRYSILLLIVYLVVYLSFVAKEKGKAKQHVVEN